MHLRGLRTAARLEAVRTTWPGIRVAQATFLEHVAVGVVRRDPPDRWTYLAGLNLGDLYLACGCLASDPEALRALDALLSSVPAIVRVVSTDGAFADDVRGLVAAELLVAAQAENRCAAGADPERPSSSKMEPAGASTWGAPPVLSPATAAPAGSTSSSSFSGAG